MLALQQGHTLQRGPTRPFPAGPSPKRGASPASKAAPLHESNPSRGRGLHHIVSYPSAACRPAPALRPSGAPPRNERCETNATKRSRSSSSYLSFTSIATAGPDVSPAPAAAARKGQVALRAPRHRRGYCCAARLSESRSARAASFAARRSARAFIFSGSRPKSERWT